MQWTLRVCHIRKYKHVIKRQHSRQHKLFIIILCELNQNIIRKHKIKYDTPPIFCIISCKFTKIQFVFPRNFIKIINISITQKLSESSIRKFRSNESASIDHWSNPTVNANLRFHQLNQPEIRRTGVRLDSRWRK